MMVVKKRGSSSNRIILGGNHSFPLFYACYLLKSIKTPKSTATYIGSTPNPPRRLRQHNGEITAGAWKTARNRPWAMQMIVHGFPSRLAALQFEWAWQHTHLSRHLKEASSQTSSAPSKNRPKSLKGHISSVRTMLSTHPYTSWPLHVKLFTVEALNLWLAADTNSAEKFKTKPIDLLAKSEALASGMPKGLSVSVELEGVDGKNELPLGVKASRDGPIDVSDARFTSAHLAKRTVLLGKSSPLVCSVCKGHLSNGDSHKKASSHVDQLNVALCPNHNCEGIAHLLCLAKRFIQEEAAGRAVPEAAGRSTLIPRGGECPICQDYVLWGAIIRACYRRTVGSRGKEQVQNDDFDKDPEEEEASDISAGTRKPGRKDGSSNTAKLQFPVKKTAKRRTSKCPKGAVIIKAKAAKPALKPIAEYSNESELEIFDLNVSDSDPEDSAVLRRPISKRYLSAI